MIYGLALGIFLVLLFSVRARRRASLIGRAVGKAVTQTTGYFEGRPNALMPRKFEVGKRPKL